MDGREVVVLVDASFVRVRTRLPLNASVNIALRADL